MVLVMGGAIMVSACGTVLRGTEQQVTIMTEPTGANIVLSDGRSCTSPCSLRAERSQPLTVSIRKDGCRSEISRLTPSVPAEGELMRGVFDYRIGGAYDLTPNPLMVKLSCGDGATGPVLGLSAADKEVMSGFGESYEVPDGGAAAPLNQPPAFEKDRPLRRATEWHGGGMRP